MGDEAGDELTTASMVSSSISANERLLMLRRALQYEKDHPETDVFHGNECLSNRKHLSGLSKKL